MSRALNGMHYCERHQGNYSNYDQSNCAVCKMSLALRIAQAALMEYYSAAQTGREPEVNDEYVASIIREALNEH